MPLVLSSEAQMVRDTALAFFQERSPVTALRKLRDDNDPVGFSRSLWAMIAELGWTGFLVSEDHGGTGFGVTGLAQVMEAAGRTLAATPLLSTALLGASLLDTAGSADQKDEHLPPLIAGERIFALALEESAHHAPTRIATTATPSGGGYRLNGTKTFVLDGVELPVRANLGIFTQPISFIGLPVVAVPVTGALPVAVQVIAAPWREDVALRIARHLEATGVAVAQRPA